MTTDQKIDQQQELTRSWANGGTVTFPDNGEWKKRKAHASPRKWLTAFSKAYPHNCMICGSRTKYDAGLCSRLYCWRKAGVYEAYHDALGY